MRYFIREPRFADFFLLTRFNEEIQQYKQILYIWFDANIK